MRYLSVLLLAVLVFPILAAGCFELTQEIWVNADGSGRMTIDLAISEDLANLGKRNEEEGELLMEAMDTEGMRSKLQENPHVKKVAVKTFKDAGFQHFFYDIEVDDVRELPALQDRIFADRETSEDEEKPDKPRLRIEKLENGNIRVLQIFEKERKKGEAPGQPSESALGGMAASMLAGRYITVRIHGDVASANGTVSEDGRMAEWKLPLFKMGTGKTYREELSAEIKVGGGGVPIVAVIVALAVVAVVIVALAVGLSMRRGASVTSS